jgi:hypothetical protein
MVEILDKQWKKVQDTTEVDPWWWRVRDGEYASNE